MRLTDEECYKRKEIENERRQGVLKKAKARGEAAEEWFKTNKLTKETKPEFDALMKQLTKY